jgi:hypothetical protein
MPWCTVAFQLAVGSGRRWSSEIDTRPNCGQRSYTAGRSFRSSRPCRVVTVLSAHRSKNGKWIMSVWKWMMSKSSARFSTSASMAMWAARSDFSGVGSSRMAWSRTGTSRARVWASAAANRVTSWPSSTSASVRCATTRSVPPYSFGGTASYRGVTWAIFMVRARGWEQPSPNLRSCERFRPRGANLCRVPGGLQSLQGFLELHCMPARISARRASIERRPWSVLKRQ